MFDVINALPKTAHPMTQLTAGIMALQVDLRTPISLLTYFERLDMTIDFLHKLMIIVRSSSHCGVGISQPQLVYCAWWRWWFGTLWVTKIILTVAFLGFWRGLPTFHFHVEFCVFFHICCWRLWHADWKWIHKGICRWNSQIQVSTNLSRSFSFLRFSITWDNYGLLLIAVYWIFPMSSSRSGFDVSHGSIQILGVYIRRLHEPDCPLARSCCVHLPQVGDSQNEILRFATFNPGYMDFEQFIENSELWHCV